MIGRWFGKKPAPAPAPTPVSPPITLLQAGGSPELDFLFIQVSAEDIEQALDGWNWLNLDGLRPIAVSAFGEIFFSDAGAAIHQLDTIEGRLTRVADSYPDLVTALQQAETRDDLLLAGLVIGARRNGLLLDPGECYDFRVAPVIGGTSNVEQMMKWSFVVKVHIAGQLHQRVKDLPPGTPIGKITIADPC